MKLQTYGLKVEFMTPVLGSQPTRDVATSYLAAKHGFTIPEDEIETLPDALEQGTTVFHRGRVNGGEGPVLFDYQMKGFLKHAGSTMNKQVEGGVANLRSKIANLVFVSPRMIPLIVPPGGEMDIIERPLRAQTAQGERVALARSEMLPEGTSFRCGMTVFPGPIIEEVLRELLDYGFYQGIGQWRGGGWGRFRYELVRED
jgi:hypothetical protein